MEITSSLKKYIDTEIIPRYAAFDAAHNLSHVQTVITNSLKLAEHYDVDIDMVFTIAAYHDLGLCNGRKFHHIDSGKILLADEQLKQWFTSEQLIVMQEAVEDHRASSEHDPRSIYGCIVSEADRSIDPERTLRRIIQYGLDNYPELSREENYQRFLEHAENKYGINGYVKLYLSESPNAKPLQRLRDMIDDKTQLRQIFDRIYDEESALRH